MNLGGLTDPTTPRPECLCIDRLVPRIGGTSGANLRSAAEQPRTDAGRTASRSPLVSLLVSPRSRLRLSR